MRTFPYQMTRSSLVIGVEGPYSREWLASKFRDVVYSQRWERASKTNGTHHPDLSLTWVYRHVASKGIAYSAAGP